MYRKRNQQQRRQVVNCPICRNYFYDYAIRQHYAMCAHRQQIKMNAVHVEEQKTVEPSFSEKYNFLLNKLSKYCGVQSSESIRERIIRENKEKSVSFEDAKQNITVERNADRLRREQQLLQEKIRERQAAMEAKESAEKTKAAMQAKEQKKLDERTRRIQMLRRLETMRMEHKKPMQLSYSLDNFNDVVSYGDFMKGKRVALVAPSKSILNFENGQMIESYDVVVRLNKALPVPKNLAKHIGSRTDVLYNSLNISDYPNENNITDTFLRYENVKYLCSPYPPIIPFKDDIDRFLSGNRYPFHHIDLAIFNKLERKLGTRPYTGVAAIVDLLNQGVSELFITGMTFFLDNYYKEYRNVSMTQVKEHTNSTYHKPKPQIRFVRQLSLADDRIKIDPVMEAILYNDYTTVLEKMSKFNMKRCFLNNKRQYISDLLHMQLDLNSTMSKSICFVGQSASLEDIEKVNETHFSVVVSFADKVMDLDNPLKVLINNSQTLDVGLLDICEVIQMCGFQNRLSDEENEKLAFLNGHFYDYFMKSVAPLGIKSVSPELFIILYYISFFGDYTIYVAGVNLYSDISRLEEYMFYKYLIKKSLISVLQ